MIMSISLRKARPSDQATIKQIIRAAGINPRGLEWPNFIVAEDEGQIVGLGQVKSHDDGSRELASIAVLPAYQKQGIASRIIWELLAHEQGTLYLICEGRLVPFYERFGFHQVARQAMPPKLRRMVGLFALVTAIVRLFGQEYTAAGMVREPGHGG